MRKKEKYVEDKAKYLALILSRLSESSKNNLRARPEYSVARDGENLLEIWRLLESIHGERGVFSDVLISQKLYSARQGTKSFEAYVIYFLDLINTLTLHEAAPSARDQTIMFLHSINRQPFQNKVRDLLTTVPLPTLSVVISQLSAQKLTDQVLLETSTSSSSSFKSVDSKKKADTEVFKVESKSDSVRDSSKRTITCYNCGEAGHLNRECSKSRVTCGRCGKDGHLDKYCSDVSELLKRSKNKKSKGRDVSLLIREDYDQFSFCGCITCDFIDDNTDCDVIELFGVDEISILESDAIADHDVQVLTPSTIYQDFSPVDNQHSFVIRAPGDTVDEHNRCNSKDHLELIMDSASQENVINNTLLFQDLIPIVRKINLIGIGGHTISATHKGKLKEFDIEALYASKATNNILSIPRMVDSGYTFWIGHKMMQIHLNGTLHSIAYRNDKGFWTVRIVLSDPSTLITMLDRHFTP